MVPDTTLIGPSRPVVLDPVSQEDLQPPVLAPDRHLHLEFTPGATHKLQNIVPQPKLLGGPVEPPGDCLERRHFVAGRLHLALPSGLACFHPPRLARSRAPSTPLPSPV